MAESLREGPARLREARRHAAERLASLDSAEVIDALMPHRLVERYDGTAARLVMYLAEASIRREPASVGKWGEVARAVRAG